MSASTSWRSPGNTCLSLVNILHTLFSLVDREDLVLYDRYQQMDGDLGIVIEPENLPTDIYPYAKVEDEEDATGVRGSCSTFASRTDRSRDLNTGL